MYCLRQGDHHGSDTAVPAVGRPPSAVAADERAGAQRQAGRRAVRARRAAPEPRLLPPAPAARRRGRVGPPQPRRRPRHVLRARAGALRRAARQRRRVAAPGAGADPGLTRRARLGAGERAVPVHGQQRALADGRGARRAAVRRCGARGQRREPSQAAAPQRGAGDARAGDRPHRPPLQASRRVHRPALRLRDQPLRSRARGLPEFPGTPQAIHWSVRDPAREPGNDEATLPAFERTAAELETRIGFLLQAIEHTTEEVIEHV